MTTATLNNAQQMSSLTRRLSDFECKYLQDTSQNRLLARKMKTHLAGRAVTFVISLILHAEAVCRAVYICFLIIGKIFSRPHKDLLRMEWEKCSSAYCMSWRSFWTSFQLYPKPPLQKIIHRFPYKTPSPPVAVVSQPLVEQHPAFPQPSPNLPEMLQPIQLPLQIIEQYFAVPASPQKPLVRAEEEFEEVLLLANPAQVQQAPEQPLPPIVQAEEEFEEILLPADPIQKALPPVQLEVVDEFVLVEFPEDPIAVALKPLPPDPEEAAEEADFKEAVQAELMGLKPLEDEEIEKLLSDSPTQEPPPSNH